MYHKASFQPGENHSSLSLPLSLLLFLVYVLGMLTGGSLFGLIKSWVQGARVKTE